MGQGVGQESIVEMGQGVSQDSMVEMGHWEQQLKWDKGYIRTTQMI